MRIDLDQGVLTLQDNRPLRMRKARDWQIQCLEGVLWITLTGMPGDICLRAGETCRLTGQGLALIESIGGARLRLLMPARKKGLSAIPLHWRKIALPALKPAALATG